MPIYMIIPRYSHNYAQFCQLLNSNFFTHRRILMLLREATSETYGPRVYSHHINLHHFNIVLLFTLPLLFTLHLYTKNTKNILSIRSHSRKWPWRAWQPLITLVASSYRFVQVDTSILKHAFISIFIALWAVVTHYVTILMPILSYFTRFTWRGRMPAAGILG